MRGAPPDLVAGFESAIRAEREAQAALAAARSTYVKAVNATTTAAVALQVAGVPLTGVGILMARALGLDATVAARRRFADLLRHRMTRRRRVRTLRHANIAAPSALPASPSLPFSDEVHEQENTMANRIIKRVTVTETLVAPPLKKVEEDVTEEDDVVDATLEDLAACDDDCDDEEDERPRRRRRKS